MIRRSWAQANTDRTRRASFVEQQSVAEPITDVSQRRAA
jgi:hypothetical protein